MSAFFSFTYHGYENLFFALRAHGYAFADYYSWRKFDKSVIIRHDMDNSLEKALQLARIERENGVRSTYFIFLTSEFYNVFQLKPKSAS